VIPEIQGEDGGNTWNYLMHAENKIKRINFVNLKVELLQHEFPLFGVWPIMVQGVTLPTICRLLTSWIIMWIALSTIV